MTPAIALQFTTPIPISSGKGKNSWTRSAADVTVTNDEAAAASISRLKTRVYNATLILSRLGKEGAENLNADGFYSSGPGDEWMPPAGRRADGGFVWFVTCVSSYLAPIAVELGIIASETVDPELSESSVTEIAPV
ncbi:MAG: hypothetical protein SEPTF4163_004577 [Sporothrix epigloea]